MTSTDKFQRSSGNSTTRERNGSPAASANRRTASVDARTYTVQTAPGSRRVSSLDGRAPECAASDLPKPHDPSGPGSNTSRNTFEALPKHIRKTLLTIDANIRFFYNFVCGAKPCAAALV